MANEDKFAKTIDDEQLDQVAGGAFDESMTDLQFLMEVDAQYGTKYVENSMGSFNNDVEFQNEVQKVFQNYGIICKPGLDGEKNEYYDMQSGKKFKSRKSALSALQVVRARNKNANVESLM